MLCLGTDPTQPQSVDSQQGPTHLPTAAAVVFPADDGEGRFAGGAEATGLIWHPFRRVCHNNSNRTEQWAGGGERVDTPYPTPLVLLSACQSLVTMSVVRVTLQLQAQAIWTQDVQQNQ